jgi:hypothetical protein
VARPAGGRLRLHVEPREAAVGDTVSVRAEVLDKGYRPALNADVILEITTPDGEFQEIPFERSLQGEDLHRAGFVTRGVGRHHLRARLRDPGGDDVVVDTAVEVDGIGREYHQAELDSARLSRLAAGTGGRFFRADDAEQVVEAVNDATSARRVERRLPLRDAPLLLGLLIALAALEWFWRRGRGLA